LLDAEKAFCLNAWPNILLTLLIIAFALFRAIGTRYSPVGVFSDRADRVFVQTILDRWRMLRGRTPGRGI
jgi:hypothetical protein